MRDALIGLLLVGTALWALRQPWIGAMVWTMVSLMSPHAQWGYAARHWPVAAGIFGCTVLGLLITKDKQSPMFGAAPWWLLGFVLWFTLTLPASVYFDESFELWVRSIKIFFMVFVTLALLNDKYRLDVFVWVVVISIGFYGLKGGVFTILTAGAYRVWGPGGFVEGNNEIALAVVTVIPLMRYLQTQLTDKRAIVAMTVVMALSVVMVLGTYSRGALLAVIAMGFYFWLKGSRKLLWGALIVVMSLVALSVMPEQWWERMNTIQDYDEDASAQGRINAWWMAFNLATERFIGGGFMVSKAAFFELYAPNPNAIHAAHSIYFQVLGEHGFIGLFLFLAVGVCTWMTAGWLIKTGRTDPRFAWAANLGPMIQVSMIGYAVGGAFLSLAYFDLPYNLMIMAVVAKRYVIFQMANSPAGAVPRTAESLPLVKS